MGCQNQFLVSLTLEASVVASGASEIEVTADGAAASCTFTIALGDGGLTVPPPEQCSSSVSVTLSNATTCTVAPISAGSSDQCQPIDGKITEEIVIVGTPAAVRVQQTVGGTTVADQSFAPTYQTVAPNGVECGPICHVANSYTTLP